MADSAFIMILETKARRVCYAQIEAIYCTKLPMKTHLNKLAL